MSAPNGATGAPASERLALNAHVPAREITNTGEHDAPGKLSLEKALRVFQNELKVIDLQVAHEDFTSGAWAASSRVQKAQWLLADISKAQKYELLTLGQKLALGQQKEAVQAAIETDQGMQKELEQRRDAEPSAAGDMAADYEAARRDPATSPVWSALLALRLVAKQCALKRGDIRNEQAAQVEQQGLLDLDTNAGWEVPTGLKHNMASTERSLKRLKEDFADLDQQVAAAKLTVERAIADYASQAAPSADA